MESYYNTVQDATGHAVNGATVTVYDSLGAVADIYTYAGVPQANPFASGLNRSEGEIEFAAANGMYDIKVVNGAETDWLRHVTLVDLAEMGDLTVEALTSNGIDDNATGERLQLADTLLTLGTAGAGYPVAHAAADQHLEVNGGSASGNGGAVRVYGGSHATKAGDIEILSGGNVLCQWDENTGDLIISTGTGTKTEAVRVYSGGAIGVAGGVLSGGPVAADDNTSSIAVYGGNTVNAGGGLVAYGGAHATLAGDVVLQSGANAFAEWDESAGSLTLSTGTGAKTAAITVDASQVVSFAATPSVGGSDVLIASDIGTTVQAYDATYLVDADIGTTVQAYDATYLVDADIGTTVQAYDATYLVDADIGTTVQAYDATYLVAADIGTTVQAYDATYLVAADIGTTVQAYDADTAKLDQAANFTAGLQSAGTTVATGAGTTGGAGSAGAGNQYIELTIGGVTYKLLHDGTV